MLKTFRTHPVAVFLTACVLITYVLGPAAYLSLRALQRSAGVTIPVINDLVMKFGPTLAGILTVAMMHGRGGLSDLFRRCMQWRTSVWMYLFVVFVPMAVLAVVLAASGYGAILREIAPATALTTFGVQLVLNVFLGGGLGEEIGWRGFLFPHLHKRRSTVMATFLVAVAWIAWHLPAYIFFGKGETDPLLPFIAILFPWSAVLTWTYVRSGGSVWLPILFHGAFNAAYYSMVELMPAVVDADGFQPAFDWRVAVCWWVLAGILLWASPLPRGPYRRARGYEFTRD